MKKNFLIIMVMFIFMLVFENRPILAQNTYSTISIEKQKLADNITEEIIIEEAQTKSSEKSGKKTVNYYNGSSLLWSVTVHGTFQYGNNTSKCISATVSTTINNSSWRVANKKAYKENNTAIAEATVQMQIGIYTIQTINRQVKLSCSNTGKLS